MKIIARDLSPYAMRMAETVEDQMPHIPRSHRGHVKTVLAGMKKEHLPTAAIDYTNELQRLYWIASVDQLNNRNVLTAIEKNKNSWKNYQSLPLATKHFGDLAETLYHCGKDTNSSIGLILHDHARNYGEQVLMQAKAHDNKVYIHVNDEMGKNLALSACPDEERAVKLAQAFRSAWSESERRITIKSEFEGTAFNSRDVSPEIKKAFTHESSAIERANKTKLWSLTSLPCPQHAALDGVSHRDLSLFYYLSSMADMDLITPAHEAGIAMLNAGSHIVIRNDHGTHLVASIAGQSFVSSKTMRNLPGSEFYGSPVLDSVNGIVISPERYGYQGNAIEGIYMKIVDGQIVDYHAQKGHDALAEILEVDYVDGSVTRFGSKGIGEFGFGTAIAKMDPAVLRLIQDKRVLNLQSSLNMMGEKRRGFHFATGRAYEDTFYGASVDNGNRSGIHKDWTLNMIDTRGDIIVDGNYMMKKGVYVPRGMEILNSMGTLRHAA